MGKGCIGGAALMPWVRLLITVEGPTERNFVNATIAPHLANFSINASARVVVTNRRLGKRGGIFDYQKIKGDLTRLMNEDRHPETRFTTMVDLYALPREFPGWARADGLNTPQDRVSVLEAAFKADFADNRFFPYIQLHEFEALLYCDLSELQLRVTGSQSGLLKLSQEVAGMNPEEIDEGQHTAPSKRIIHHVPIYEKAKVRVGASAAAAIGLATLRSKCPHFNKWMTDLEAIV
jgi:hypothetical protein